MKRLSMAVRLVDNLATENIFPEVSSDQDQYRPPKKERWDWDADRRRVGGRAELAERPRHRLQGPSGRSGEE